MSATLIIQGRMGSAPTFKTLPNSDTALAEFSVAVNHYKGPNKEATSSWFRVKVFGKGVESLRKWNKGDLVLVSGDLEIQEWTDKEGAKRTTAELVGRTWENSNIQLGVAGRDGGRDEQAPASRPAAAPSAATYHASLSRPGKPEEEELPF